MIGTVLCVYETPCGWCAKWDKKCDKKIVEDIEVEKPNATSPTPILPTTVTCDKAPIATYSTKAITPDWFTGGDRGDILG